MKLQDLSGEKHFIHSNFTTFSNHSVPILVEMSRNTTIDGHEFDFSLRWDIFYMIDAFERHELDSITGQEKVTIYIFDYIFIILRS